MAFADEAVPLASPERRRARREFRFRPVGELEERRPVGPSVGITGASARNSAARSRRTSSGDPNGPSARAMSMRPWKSATMVASASMCARSKLTAREHAARERVLRELAHLHRVLEGRAAAADRRMRDAAGNWDNVEIKRGREPAIEPQFLLAIEAPGGERGEIEEPECNGLLDLVRVAPGQEHVGNVRLEPLDALAIAAEHRRIAERRDESRLICRGINRGRARHRTIVPAWASRRSVGSKNRKTHAIGVAFASLMTIIAGLCRDRLTGIMFCRCPAGPARA